MLKDYSKDIEKKWQEYWQKHKIYNFNQKSGKNIFSIDTPPPTVSGRMHMGHAFGYILIDIVARFKRMKGEEVFYSFGLDDNGIATNLMVEKNLRIKAKDFTREEFIKIASQETEKVEKEMIKDFKSLGLACDWNLLYRTINDYCRKQAQRSFLEIYNMKRAYRTQSPALFCTSCETAISQLELKDKELESTFNDIVFKVDGKELIISTTRPELLPATVAVFYHPQDARYKHFKAKKAKVPLFNFEVPIMEDERVSIDKGTGIVMCCTFGDQVDMQWQKAYKLPIKQAISSDGKMTEIAGKYQGLSISDARANIIEDLKENKLLKKQEKITHIVNVHERCDKEVEIINTEQWFVKYLDLKNQFLLQARKIKWHPEYMRTRYDNWVNGLQWDWCISRQRYFGVPIPVWYCKKCHNVLLPEDSQLPINPLHDKPRKKCKCGSLEFIAEKDTLDTWFISSLTPQITCKWKEDEKFFRKMFPMSIRPQGQEIISFWAFNTIVKALLHNKNIPWKDIIINGWILDPYGEKMSKSKGNIIMPYTMVEKYSADAMRFWASTISLGDDSAFQEKELIAGTRLITKLWNASKFILNNIKNKPKKLKLMEIDKAIISKLNSTIKKVNEELEKFNFPEAKKLIEQFFWHVFCDNYLEIIKDRIYNKKGIEKESAEYTLYHSLLNILKMFSLFMPHVTEEIFQNLKEKENSIHLTGFPEYNKKLEDKNAEENLDLFLKILSNVRQEKTKFQKSMKSEIILTIEKKDKAKLKNMLSDLIFVTNSKQIKEGKFKLEFI